MLSDNLNAFAAQADDLQPVSGSVYLCTAPPDPEQIIGDFLDVGDKMALIGSSKTRKTFLLQQIALSMTAGRDIFSWHILKARRVFYCQFEIREHHFHRRLRNMGRAMGITADDIGDRLQVINARGLDISGTAGVERIAQVAMGFEPEVIVFDPLYKLAAGVENASEDMKIILNAFDALAEQTGAAIVYVHHDAKGSPGDRDIRDRGAGSNVLGRDYDACIAMTPHATEDDSIVVDTLLRNYPPREPFVISWQSTGDGYCFGQEDIMPDKRTSATPKNETPVEAYLPMAKDILIKGPMDISVFRESFRQKSGITYARLKAFLGWAEEAGTLETQSARGRGFNKKRIGLPGAFDSGQV